MTTTRHDTYDCLLIRPSLVLNSFALLPFH